MRKIVIFALIFLLVIIGVVVYFYVDFLRSSRSQNTLSDRAKEFLQEQKTKNNSYSNLRLENGKVIDQDITVEKCFSFQVPFRIKNINTDSKNPCYRYVSFENPKGSIVIYREDAGGLSIDEAPGIALRRLKKDTYKEESIVLGGQKFLVFQDTTKPFEKTAYTKSSDFYIIATLSVTDPEVSKEKFMSFLASVKAN